MMYTRGGQADQLLESGVNNQQEPCLIHLFRHLSPFMVQYNLDISTSWGKWSASRPGRALPQKGPSVPIG
jgi:hypothetical protein